MEFITFASKFVVDGETYTLPREIVRALNNPCRTTVKACDPRMVEHYYSLISYLYRTANDRDETLCMLANDMQSVSDIMRHDVANPERLTRARRPVLTCERAQIKARRKLGAPLSVRIMAQIVTSPAVKGWGAHT
jgi:hypothetical protein